LDHHRATPQSALPPPFPYGLNIVPDPYVQGAATFCANVEWMADPMDVMAWGVDCEAAAAAK
jgi:hypothetical protein